MDCSLEGSFLSPWNYPARILELGTIPFSRGSSRPRDRTQVSCIAGRFFTLWAISEALPSSQYQKTSRNIPALDPQPQREGKLSHLSGLQNPYFLSQAWLFPKMTDSRSCFSFWGNSILTFIYCDLIRDSNKTITQMYWKEKSKFRCGKNPRFQQEGSGFWKGLLCALHPGIRKRFYFFALSCILVFYYFQISVIHRITRALFKKKKRAKTAWLMWPMGPACTALPWEGVSGLGASGLWLVCVPMALPGPACRGAGRQCRPSPPRPIQLVV